MRKSMVGGLEAVRARIRVARLDPRFHDLELYFVPSAKSTMDEDDADYMAGSDEEVIT
jgi:hypothetical protein